MSGFDAVVLAVVAVAWVVVAMSLAVDLPGLRRRDRAYRWMSTGGLLGLSGTLVEAIARARQWPPGPARLLTALVMTGLLLPGAGCVLVAARVKGKRA